MANVIKIPNRYMAVSRPTTLVFGQSGYYTPTKDCVVKIHLIGGGGGGANGGYPSYYGAGGGYVIKTLRVKGGVSYNVTVGAGGSGAGQTTNQPFSPFESLNGSAGGNTSFNHHSIDPIIAYGGGGSAQIGPAPSFSPGAIGGWGSGGDVILQGGHATNRGMSAVSGKFTFDTFYGAFQAIDIAGQAPLTSGYGYLQGSPASPAQPVGPGGIFLAAPSPGNQPGAGNRAGVGGGGSSGVPGTQPGSPFIAVKGGGGSGGSGLVVIEEL